MRRSRSLPFPVSPAMIKQAWKRLNGFIKHTPITSSLNLTNIADTSVFVKWECLQKTGVFKIRGAFNKIASLSLEVASRGVVTASTGNHALAVALAAKHHKIPATVIVPEAASPLKIKKCKQYGATIITHGVNYDEAATYSVEYAKEQGSTLIHAYADPLVIAGQGTIGYEILDEHPETNVVIVPIGGGGLISGISLWVKTQRSNIRVIGVQTTATRAFYENFHAKRLYYVPVEPTIADGLAGNTEQLNLDIGLKYVDDIVLVEESGLRHAIRWTMENEHQILEPAGVVGIAAILQGKVKFHSNEKVVVVATGSNIDPKLFKDIMQS